MHLTTASLPPGRLRAFLEQRIEHQGAYMCRLAAIQDAIQRAEGYEDTLRYEIVGPINAQHVPIEDDLTWSPPPEDDVELDMVQTELFERHRRAEALLGLNRI